MILSQSPLEGFLDQDTKKLVDAVLAGETRGISRAISAVENDAQFGYTLLKELFPHTGKAHVIGVTGPPGAGKSTLTDRMIASYRAMGKTVGVIAVDPTSPFSGGAILGDRVRMGNHFTDPGVYIRSMATRGTLGGISSSTYDAVTILEASGKDIVVIETVGVGQDEIDIINTAHTSAVVLMPGMGDDIQSIKAGILEIGDLFIVNKADRQGAERLATELNIMLEMADNESQSSWRPPVLKTVARDGEGLKEVMEALEQHRTFIRGDEEGRGREIARSRHRIRELWREAAMDRLLPELLPAKELEKAAEMMADRKAEPYSLIEGLMKRLKMSL